VAGFPLLTDNHVRQQIVEGLRVRGWDVVHAIDVFPEGTDDEVLFEYAATQGRVFVSSDEPAQEIP
jgi:predicted nuclease of predicted toxin-antitoxin system